MYAEERARAERLQAELNETRQLLRRLKDYLRKVGLFNGFVEFIIVETLGEEAAKEFLPITDSPPPQAE